jgi:hypothetical protein
MPLDGIDHGAADALRIIDAVIARLGPKGERWHHGTRDAKGKYCLRSALRYARRKLKTAPGDPATDYIRQAIREVPGLPGFYGYVEAFNSRGATKFRDVREVLLRAKELAAIGAGV